MLIRPKASNVNPHAPVQFWLLVGTSCVALFMVLSTLSTRTVQADAQLPRPATSGNVVQSPTPSLTSPAPASVKRRGKILRGLASWYGSVFNGRHTASGERFDMYAMTACHPSLPFGTLVRVVNLSNRQAVVVRITDRNDLLHGRMIDLSYGAAAKLHMTEAGLAKVSLEVLSLGNPGLTR